MVEDEGGEKEEGALNNLLDEDDKQADLDQPRQKRRKRSHSPSPSHQEKGQNEHLSDFSDFSSRQDSQEGSQNGEKQDPEAGSVTGHKHKMGEKEFTMKNGCCRECMKAFSKNGKVSLL